MNRVLSRLLKPVAVAAFRSAQVAVRLVSGNQPPAVLIAETMSEEESNDVAERLRFFAPSLATRIRSKTAVTIPDTFSSRPLLAYGNSTTRAWWRPLRKNVFDVDPRVNPTDGWDWCRLSKYDVTPLIDRTAERRFRARIQELKQLNLTKAYIFATGPSLAKASDRDWTDGYRIVCNTIVRDGDLWRHLNPHFIVAGDANYHFGYTTFARAFRADLAKRMSESETYFVFPAVFSEIVSRELGEFSSRLIPVPRGNHQDVHTDLTQTFGLSGLGNVLNLLLLPLACTLSRNIYLWGFDGRAPSDKLFWANSDRHTYAEFMPDLRKAHPAFFAHYVPPEDPEKYVRSVHGDDLDRALQVAEHAGFRFEMMHESWTPALQKRYMRNCDGAGR